MRPRQGHGEGLASGHHPPGVRPGHATRAQYGEATALEALLGWLYLGGRRDRVNELFCVMMEEAD